LSNDVDHYHYFDQSVQLLEHLGDLKRIYLSDLFSHCGSYVAVYVMYLILFQ